MFKIKTGTRKKKIEKIIYKFIFLVDWSMVIKAGIELEKENNSLTEKNGTLCIVYGIEYKY